MMHVYFGHLELKISVFTLITLGNQHLKKEPFKRTVHIAVIQMFTNKLWMIMFASLHVG